MVGSQTSYKCNACGATKTIPAEQKAPTCCGKVMQETTLQNPSEDKKGSCGCG